MSPSSVNLGSRNGSYLDGVRLRGACCPEACQVLRVGHCVFLFGEGLAAQAEAVELAATPTTAPESSTAPELRRDHLDPSPVLSGVPARSRLGRIGRL